MKIDIELDEQYLRRLILKDLQAKLGDVELSEKDITIEVKSRQNYRAEWEAAAFRARTTKFVLGAA